MTLVFVEQPLATSGLLNTVHPTTPINYYYPKKIQSLMCSYYLIQQGVSSNSDGSIRNKTFTTDGRCAGNERPIGPFVPLCFQVIISLCQELLREKLQEIRGVFNVTVSIELATWVDIGLA